MKLTNRNYANFQIENPIEISKEQIMSHYINSGFSEENAKKQTDFIYKNVRQFVSKKYQSEVEYFLQNNKTSDTEIGKEINFAMQIKNRFFDALLLYVRSELRDGKH